MIMQAARTTLVMTLVATLVACGGSASSPATPSIGSAAPHPSPMSADVRVLVGTNDILSSAVRYGDLIWTAGHLPEGVSAVAPMQDQVEQVLDDLEATLEASGAGFDTLLKVNIYLLDWNDWETFNQIYVDRIGPYGLPPRTTVQVAHIGLDYRIEMEMVAHVRPPTP